MIITKVTTLFENKNLDIIKYYLFHRVLKNMFQEISFIL